MIVRRLRHLLVNRHVQKYMILSSIFTQDSQVILFIKLLSSQSRTHFLQLYKYRIIFKKRLLQLLLIKGHFFKQKRYLKFLQSNTFKEYKSMPKFKNQHFLQQLYISKGMKTLTLYQTYLMFIKYFLQQQLQLLNIMKIKDYRIKILQRLEGFQLKNCSCQKWNF